MRNRSRYTSVLLVFVAFVMLVKIIAYILIKQDVLSITFGGHNDSDYYHAYAMSYTDMVTSIWPVMLRRLNDFGLYNREAISFLLFFIHIVLIPCVFCRIVEIKWNKNNRLFLLVILLIGVYPSLFFNSLDMYRDVFMVYMFLIAVLFIKNFILKKRNAIVGLIFALLICWFLSHLRGYLAFAIWIAICLFWIKITKYRLVFMLVAYLCALFALNNLGFLDSLIDYREQFFGILEGGSNLRLDFSNKAMFIPNFTLSFLYQMLGFYWVNTASIIVFFGESVVFIYMLFYVVKNVKYYDKFVVFLLCFFIVYSSVWLIGNDNLGSATRIRMFNYFSIYMCYFYIYNKIHSLNYN